MAQLLLIDDDPSLLEVLTLACEDAGHAVRTALDGAAGMRALEAGRGGAGREHPEQPGIFVITQHLRVELFELATGNSMHLS